ncbi:hypothetical protein Pan44_43190 [Caulifigura coniformis]|uniref:Fibronectin type-III domain-containing protein n=1 Tax=Caulifigura coniformis TaxID=2527983 RepID=A0A517SJH9_9PLAN|nr:fibronectin type III domain-containing protein [Caulifigura coniformis]QDT56267.1 hypothetical protein Pan44_43190 [Caulifigura coniformis]
MKRFAKRRIGMMLVCLAGGSAAVTGAEQPIVQAGCNCQQGGGGGMAMPMPVETPHLRPTPGYSNWTPGPMPPTISGPVVSLPPGTLGQTYVRPSAPVPAVKHPRAGMIDVRATGATSVSVQWTHPYRLEDELEGFVDAKDKDVFHFEEKQMLPGVPYIVRIEARYGTEDNPRYEERYARLIMGRIVSVDFDEKQ